MSVQRRPGPSSARFKAATRRKYTPEEKVRIVLEGFRREVTVSDLCRREGIKPHSYYSWTKEFMEAGKERLTRDTVRDATREEVHQLKRENGELKQLVADLSLEVYRLKKTSIPCALDLRGLKSRSTSPVSNLPKQASHWPPAPLMLWLGPEASIGATAIALSIPERGGASCVGMVCPWYCTRSRPSMSSWTSTCTPE